MSNAYAGAQPTSLTTTMPQKRTCAPDRTTDIPKSESIGIKSRLHQSKVKRRANTLFTTAVSRPDSSKQYLSAGSAGRKFEYGTVTRSQRRGHRQPASLRRANTRSGFRRAVAGFLRQPRAGLEAECSGAGSASVVVAGPEAHRQRGGTARRGRGARRRAERPVQMRLAGCCSSPPSAWRGGGCVLFARPKQGGRVGGMVGVWMDRRVRPLRQYRSKAAESAREREWECDGKCSECWTSWTYTGPEAHRCH